MIEKEQKQTCLSWRERNFTRNMIKKNKTKTRKALPNDLSFLIVMQAPWDIELNAS